MRANLFNLISDECFVLAKFLAKKNLNLNAPKILCLKKYGKNSLIKKLPQISSKKSLQISNKYRRKFRNKTSQNFGQKFTKK
jgi:hypothetical protein